MSQTPTRRPHSVDAEIVLSRYGREMDAAKTAEVAGVLWRPTPDERMLYGTGHPLMDVYLSWGGRAVPGARYEIIDTDGEQVLAEGVLEPVSVRLHFDGRTTPRPFLEPGHTYRLRPATEGPIQKS